VVLDWETVVSRPVPELMVVDEPVSTETIIHARAPQAR
jgi:hypothetical protein